MNSKDRMKTAMSRQVPDRAPVMCQLSIGHYLLNTGIPPSRLWFTSEGFAEALITLCRRYRFDGILINLPGRDPNWLKKVAKIEPGPGGSEIVHWQNGDITECPKDDLVKHFPAGGRRFPTLEEVDPEKLYYNELHDECGLKYPFYYGMNPYETNRDSYFPEYLTRTIDIVLREVGDSVSVHAEISSPFTQLMELLDYSTALMSLVDDPEKCQAILDALTEGSIAFGKLQVSRGIDAVVISSPFAGSGFISPAFYRKFVLPYEKRIVGSLKETGVFVYTHTCGSIGDRLPLMAETGVDGIECLDPPPIGDTDLAEAKALLGNRLFIKGNIDPVNTMLTKKPAEVRADARQRLKIGAPGGGYILSTACSVPPYVKPENIQVLVEAAEEGSY
ncbi:MAG: uroporphyrinogen decarboxylase family protein [Bacillota bacterium]